LVAKLLEEVLGQYSQIQMVDSGELGDPMDTVFKLFTAVWPDPHRV